MRNQMHRLNSYVIITRQKHKKPINSLGSCIYLLTDFVIKYCFSTNDLCKIRRLYLYQKKESF